jgi:hypothetical protein
MFRRNILIAVSNERMNGWMDGSMTLRILIIPDVILLTDASTAFIQFLSLKDKYCE